MTRDARADLETIFSAALRRVDPRLMIRRCLEVDGSSLRIDTEEMHERVDLKSFTQILMLGIGKAGAPMARGTEEVLGDRIAGGVIVVKEGYLDCVRRAEIVEAGHPVPNEASVLAARKLLACASSGGRETLFVNLISGGGSALVAAPRTGTRAGLRDLTLNDLTSTTQALLRCGASIDEINTVRKHLSRVKGGQLAAALYPSSSVSLILSDVVGDRLDTIASGPTVGDPTTFADAMEIIGRYEIADEVPAAVVEHLSAGERGEIEETPKPGSEVFTHVKNVLVGTNRHALATAKTQAEELGYRTVIVTSELTGEATVAASYVVEQIRIARDPSTEERICLLFGGETTVTIRGSGRGGRNQELALAVLARMGEGGSPFDDVAFLSAGTDGSDGPTPAAGAFASSELARKAASMDLSASSYLANNDSNTFHSRLGSLFVTGPTNTNVCDIQIAIVRPGST
jgi:glycerate 2-kinase